MHEIHHNTGIIAQRGSMIDAGMLFFLLGLALWVFCFRASAVEAEHIDLPFTVYGDAFCPVDFPVPGPISSDGATFRCMRHF